MKSIKNVRFWLVILLSSIFAFGFSLNFSNDTKLSQELATMFRAARKVISDNHKHINDPNVGDKGLPSKEVVRQTKENYKSATGITFSFSSDANESKAQKALFSAIEKVMEIADKEFQINEKGKGFKGFLPAVFARHLATEFSAIMDNKIQIKLTAPKDYVRNRKNRPDKWEHDVIETKFRSPGWEKNKSFSEVTDLKGDKVARFILPEYYGNSCLGCHGEPKGEKDITGGKKEGGKLGELGGAISVIIYK